MKPLLPAAMSIYLLTLLALWHGLLLHVLVGVVLMAGLFTVHLRRRFGWRWAAPGTVGFVLLWPVAVPAMAVSAAHARRQYRYPLYIAAAAAMSLPLGVFAYSGAVNEVRVICNGVDSVSNPPNTQAGRKAYVMQLLGSNPFQPPWWLANAHAQTFWGPFMRRDLQVQYRSERWTTPDGDFVRVQFYDAESSSLSPEAGARGQDEARGAVVRGRPLVLLLHGLEGSATSPYIRGFNKLFHEEGWDVATMEFRFCSGEPNTAKRIYHMGETSDCDFVVRRLAQQFSGRPIFLCGFSLGGNVLAKWLGEQGETVPSNLVAAAVISPPFDPLISAPDFHKILGGFYAWNFLRSLKPKALQKAEQYPGIIDTDVLLACNDFYTYDTIVTAALHGFEDAEDYWRKVGCHQFLPHIRVPTMLLTSADDPFNPPETIPRAAADASPWLHPQWAERGGHVGFVMGPAPWRPRYWMEEQTLTFFAAYLELTGRA